MSIRRRLGDPSKSKLRAIGVETPSRIALGPRQRPTLADFTAIGFEATRFVIADDPTPPLGVR